MLFHVVHDIILLKEATGNFLLPPFIVCFLRWDRDEISSLIIWNLLELSITYLRIFKLLSPPADGQKPFASGSQTISAKYVLLLTPNYITANCSGWCCIKGSWRELPPAPRDGHWSPDFCVDTDPAGLRRGGNSARMYLWESVWAAGTRHLFNSQAHGRGKPKASQGNINSVFSDIC